MDTDDAGTGRRVLPHNDQLRTNPTPAAEVVVDESLVRRLLVDQAPELAGESLALLANGWDNIVFRLGDAHVVRMPRRALAADLIGHEQRWLPELAPRLPVPIPVPVVRGGPAHGYPWRWSVTRWIPGELALRRLDPENPAAGNWMAEPLGEFLHSMHVAAPADAPENPFRGIPLAQRAEIQTERAAMLGDLLDPGIGRLWAELADVPAWSGSPLWLHGDMHPLNIVVNDESIAGVIDFGDLTSGDPASDLAVGFMLFDSSGRQRFRESAGEHSDHTWNRSRAWAIALGTAFLAHSGDNPDMMHVADFTLSQALSG